MKYFCVGEHLHHSFSKELHSMIGDYNYNLLEVSPEEFDCLMADKDFSGINITIPYKERVLKYLDFISDNAKEIGAVNTVVNRNGKLYGYNTDFDGLKALILRENIVLKNKKVLICGTGGTSKTAFCVAKNLGAKEIYKLSRSNKDDAFTYEYAYKMFNDAEIIINTTPCGMYPKMDESPADLDKFPNLSAVLDVVYNPLKTKLCMDAESRKIKSVCGLYMLVGQAVRASEIFFGIKQSNNKIDEIYNKIYKQKENIVLTGMPSSGKSTLGKILAKELKRDFFDLDDEIEKQTNKTIKEIFSVQGESGFRKIESEVLKNKLANKNSCVISTGGGTVINPDNVSLLRHNGRIYFIDRPKEMLFASDNRPLSQNKKDIEKLYSERYDIYKNSADVIVDNSKEILYAIEKIRKDFEF